MKRIAVIAAAVAAGTCAAAVWGQGGPPLGPGGPMPMMGCAAMAAMTPHPGMADRLAKALGLTRDQTARLQKSLAGHESSLRSLRSTSARSSRALHDALLSPKSSAKSLRDLAAKAEKAEAAVTKAEVEEWIQIRSILKPGQVAKLAKAMGRPGPFGPPPGAPGFPPPPPPGR